MTATQATSSTTGVLTCRGKLVRHPRWLVLTCGSPADPELTVTGIAWSRWTSTRAAGRGTLRAVVPLFGSASDQPDAGKSRLAARIVLRRPHKAVPDGQASARDVRVFSQAIITTSQVTPQWTRRRQVVAIAH